MKKIIIRFIKLYQLILSPLLGRNCKYHPSCSNYFINAVKINGYKGLLQGSYRILRCNPFSIGGYDPVKKLN